MLDETQVDTAGPERGGRQIDVDPPYRVLARRGPLQVDLADDPPRRRIGPQFRELLGRQIVRLDLHVKPAPRALFGIPESDLRRRRHPETGMIRRRDPKPRCRQLAVLPPKRLEVDREGGRVADGKSFDRRVPLRPPRQHVRQRLERTRRFQFRRDLPPRRTHVRSHARRGEEFRDRCQVKSFQRDRRFEPVARDQARRAGPAKAPLPKPPAELHQPERPVVVFEVRVQLLQRYPVDQQTLARERPLKSIRLGIAERVERHRDLEVNRRGARHLDRQLDPDPAEPPDQRRDVEILERPIRRPVSVPVRPTRLLVRHRPPRRRRDRTGQADEDRDESKTWGEPWSVGQVHDETP